MSKKEYCIVVVIVNNINTRFMGSILEPQFFLKYIINMIGAQSGTFRMTLKCSLNLENITEKNLFLLFDIDPPIIK